MSGIGKTAFVSNYIVSQHSANCVWISCEGINKSDIFIDRLFSVLPNEINFADDLFVNIARFEECIMCADNPVIVIDHLEPDVDGDIINSLLQFHVPVIVTSYLEALDGYYTYCLDLPPESICSLIYASYLFPEYRNDLFIKNIIQIIGRHPLFIELYAKANAIIRSTPKEFFTTLSRNKDKIFTQVAVRGKQNSLATIYEHIRNTFGVNCEFEKSELDVLSVLAFLPPIPIPQNFIAFLIRLEEYKFNTFSQLIMRGMIRGVFVYDDSCIELPSITREYISISEIFQSEIEDTILLQLLELLSKASENDFFISSYSLNVLCKICEHIIQWNRKGENVEELNGVLLYYKAIVNIRNYHYKSAINDCSRAYEIISKLDTLQEFIIRVKCLHVNACIEYGDSISAERTIKEIKTTAEDDEYVIQFLKEAEVRLLFIHPYHIDFTDVIMKLHSMLKTEDPVEKISLYQRLATVSYYQYTCNSVQNNSLLIDALEYGEYAIELLNTESMNLTGIASCTFTAYSAALCAAGRLNEAIEWGRKGLVVAQNVYGDHNNHTFTSRKNLGNALFYNELYTDALHEYNKILAEFDEVYYPNQELMAHTYSFAALCELMSGNIDKATTSTEYIFSKYQNDSFCYPYAINAYLIVGIRLSKKRDIVMLQAILDIVESYVFSKYKYPNMPEFQIVFMRLRFIAFAGTEIYHANYGTPDIFHVNLKYDKMCQMILNGYLDKGDE